MKLELGKLYRLKKWDASRQAPPIHLYPRYKPGRPGMNLCVGDVFMYLGTDNYEGDEDITHVILMPGGEILGYSGRTWLGREPEHFFERAGQHNGT